MQKLGGLAQEFHDVITTSARTPSHEVASKTAALMSANFATRIELYGTSLCNVLLSSDASGSIVLATSR
jgi:hypothetical protein